MATCDICKKEIDGREICGHLEGHVCIQCGYQPRESESDSILVANLSVGIFPATVLVLYLVKIFFY